MIMKQLQSWLKERKKNKIDRNEYNIIYATQKKNDPSGVICQTNKLAVDFVFKHKVLQERNFSCPLLIQQLTEGVTK